MGAVQSTVTPRPHNGRLLADDICSFSVTQPDDSHPFVNRLRPAGDSLGFYALRPLTGRSTAICRIVYREDIPNSTYHFLMCYAVGRHNRHCAGVSLTRRNRNLHGLGWV